MSILRSFALQEGYRRVANANPKTKSSVCQSSNRSFPQIYPNSFVNLIIQGQSGVCRDPNKLRYICEKFYEQYSNTQRIQFYTDQQPKIQSNLVYQTTNELNMTSELTFCGKYLLIAAYLASYNAASTDKRFFSKFQGEKQSKRGRKASAFAKEDKQAAGPKKFTFERLYQIYHALLILNNINDKEMGIGSPTNQLFQQFQTFVSTKLVVVADSVANYSQCSSSAKYCISDFITERFVREIAHSVDVNLVDFLEKNTMKG